MSRIISSDSLTAYRRWELPSVEETVRPPTPEEIAEIQRVAHDESFVSGHEDGRRAGYAEGFKQGVAEGQAEGFQRGFDESLVIGREEVLKRVQHLDDILSWMSKPLEQLDKQVEEALAGLAITIAKHMVRKELRTSPGEIVALTRSIISLLPVSSTKVKVYLNPEDAQVIREVLAMGQREEPTWKMIDDPNITCGGCVVNTDVSRIDATVEKRLNAVIATVLGDGL